ncbi:tRNA (5-methylaminomethyl-2-thiouridine)(34)-methyltransferase MnmD [Nitrosophilus labii]|uniref:tRNA (5-methylaminomethyl-2-thiouridine)(34)-methyltransferase MnmD n=1 Tax=Nitrosophilus labii TaxID=2706014 RepID=UPI0016569F28|nr:MnmC family methyltransferase [Nitrosophilus labii]
MKRVKTKDETYTLYSEEFDECYHNVNDGALSESLKKHVEPAFLYAAKKDELTILDICFGLGYNTLTTLYYLKKNKIDKKIRIISPEFDENLIRNLKSFDYPKEFDPLKNVINSILNNLFYEDEKIKIEIKIGDAREVIKKIDKQIDILYQDPFSPKKNPLLWTVEYFKDISRIMNDEGIITTYSIAASVRLALYESGFRVFEREIEGIKKQTVASRKELPLKEIDMKTKKKRSSSKALRDRDAKKI